MHTAIAGNQQRLAHRQQLVRGLLQRGGGDVRVDACQCGQQVFSQHHLAVVGAGGLVAIGGDLRAVGMRPAQLGKPANGCIFQFLFGDHSPTSQ